MNHRVRSVRAFLVTALLASLVAGSAGPAAAAEVALDYLYNLSTFTGALQSSWVWFGADRERKEVYVINPADQSVSVFNSTGLLVYSFGDEGDFGYISGVAIGDGGGDIYVLSSMGERSQVFVANYRGELQQRLTLTNLPPLFKDNFTPNRIFFRNGLLYLADTANFKVLTTDPKGNYVNGLDFAPLINVNYAKLSDFNIFGFTVDGDGNYIFSLPVQALVYLISPDGKLASFGKRGSSPGKFNIVSGVAADDRGYLYVLDTLRCVVMIFDRNNDFAFKGEFGYRGFDPGELISPRELTVLDDMLYVSQSANRGVSVFRIAIK